LKSHINALVRETSARLNDVANGVISFEFVRKTLVDRDPFSLIKLTPTLLRRGPRYNGLRQPTTSTLVASIKTG